MIRASFSSDIFEPDALLAGNTGLLLSKKVTLLSGQNLTRGALLGKITANGKYLLSLAAAGDGSEVPDAVLAEDADASAGDIEALVFYRGDFNQNAMTFGGGHTAATVREGLRSKGISLINAQA